VRVPSRLDARFVLSNHVYDPRQAAGKSPEEITEIITREPAIGAVLAEIRSDGTLFADKPLTFEEFMSHFSREPSADMFVLFLSRDSESEKVERGGLDVLVAEDSTGVIRFLQLLVLYAVQFGAVGDYDIAGLRTFVAKYAPGVVFANRPLSDEDVLLLAAAADLGVPVCSYGNCVIPITSVKPIAQHEVIPTVKAMCLKGRFHHAFDAKPATGEAAPSDYLFEAGGTVNSFFIVRAMGGIDGVDVRGKPGKDMGIIIDLGDDEVDEAMTAYLEGVVEKIISARKDLSISTRHGFKIKWSSPTFSAQELGEYIHKGLKSQFSLKKVSVSVLFDPLRLAAIKGTILAYRDTRRKKLDGQNEANSSFYVCRRCQSYAKHHVCVVTSERPPSCGLTYEMVKTMAHLSASDDFVSVRRGELLDGRRGEYSGINKIVRVLTEGHIQRIFLHSLSQFPHPTSALLENIAFVIPEVDGIGIVSRGYKGVTPASAKFTDLEGRAAGRQVAGVVGVSDLYIKSPKFMHAEGGLARVVWMTSELKKRLDLESLRVATEKDCTTVAGLKRFYQATRNE
jgi:hypothetical protein